MLLAILLIIIIFWIVVLLNKKTVKSYDYKCFLLTIPGAKERRERFYASHNKDIPIEVIYGPDTRTLKNAREYEDLIEPEYFEKAIEMYYNPIVIRPDITYFNLGAIGCYMGHMEFYERCFRQNLKYAVIFEDNVIVTSNDLYDEIQDFINKRGDTFEMCFFHCLSRLPGSGGQVKWISSTKCYLVHVDNMRKYHKYFSPMDNHVDMKHEDLIDRGARVYYKDLRDCLKIDRSHKSLIGHSNHGRPEFFSKVYPELSPSILEIGY